MVFITNQSINAEIKRQQKLAYDIAGYQQQISTGVKFDKPSDNPQDWIQISNIGKQQSLAGAWKDNLGYAESRSAQAATSLDDVSNLMTDVTNKLIGATAQGANTPGSEAIALTLEGVRASIYTILHQTDYQGTPTFDDGVSTTIPVGKGVAYEAVGTRQGIESGIVTQSGPKSIYDILDAAIAAVRSGDSTGISKGLEETKAALDHVIVEGTRQGVRAVRLENETDRLSTANLQLTERRSNLEDTDLTEVITRVQSKLVSLQAAQAAFAKINQQSLFDLLR
ncbi:MAG TPA: flagellin [Sphingobium sp.]